MPRSKEYQLQPNKRLKYDPAIISHSSPATIRRMYSDKEIRAAYAKFRKQFRGRVKEFEASEYAGSGVLDDAAAVFGNTGRTWDIVAVVHALQEITKWLQTATSSVEGMRIADQRRLQTLQDKGLTMIKTPQDLRDFGRFMKSVRPYFDKQHYSSDQAVELFDYAQENNISIPNLQKHFKFYVDHIDEITEADLSVQVGKNRGKARKKAWTARQIAERLDLDYDGTESIY